MPCCTHTCTCIQWCEKWKGCFVPNIFSQRWWLDLSSSPTLSPSQRTGEQRDGSRGYIYTSFYFYLSQGGSWNHSEVPREAGETSSWSGNETWTSVSYCSVAAASGTQTGMFAVFGVSWYRWMWRHRPSGPSFVCMVASVCIVLHIFDELCRTQMKDATAS